MKVLLEQHEVESIVIEAMGEKYGLNFNSIELKSGYSYSTPFCTLEYTTPSKEETTEEEK